jgi:hypothetical protein
MHRDEWSRREFLKTAGQCAFALGGIMTFGSLINSCATMSSIPKDKGPVKLRQLTGHKIKYPEKGILFGVDGFGERRPDDYSGGKDRDPATYLQFYKDVLGHLPAFNGRMWAYADDNIRYPASFIDGNREIGVIPYNFLSMNTPARMYGGLENLVDNKEFNHEVKLYASMVTDQKMPHFITTMREVNSPYYRLRVWKGKSAKTTTKLMRHIWQICEDEGANEYLTWVWEIIPPDATPKMRNPERFFPGEKFVDWIGLSTYYQPYREKGFSSHIDRTYEKMQENHPEIPSMMAEIGYTRKPGKDFGQSQWFDDALQVLSSLKAIKAMMVINGSNKKRDHTLSKETYQVLRKYLDNGTLIGAESMQQKEA